MLNVVAGFVLMVCGGYLAVLGFRDGNTVSGVVGLVQVGLGAYCGWWAVRERRRLR
jgi:uncharacterized membrane protein YoaK (UPF0700 family)